MKLNHTPVPSTSYTVSYIKGFKRNILQKVRWHTAEDRRRESASSSSSPAPFASRRIRSCATLAGTKSPASSNTWFIVWCIPNTIISSAPESKMYKVVKNFRKEEIKKLPNQIKKSKVQYNQKLHKLLYNSLFASVGSFPSSTCMNHWLLGAKRSANSIIRLAISVLLCASLRVRI